MRVARAEEKDLPQIVDRWKEMMDLHQSLDPLFTRSSDGHVAFEAHLRDCVASPQHLLLVAIEGKEVQGYLLAHLVSRPPVFQEREFGEISDIAVREDCRRMGIGERMLKVALKWFKTKGIERIEVRAVPANHMALGFWTKQGFQEHYRIMQRKA